MLCGAAQRCVPREVVVRLLRQRSQKVDRTSPSTHDTARRAVLFSHRLLRFFFSFFFFLPFPALRFYLASLQLAYRQDIPCR